MTVEHIRKNAAACRALYGTSEPGEILKNRNVRVKRISLGGLRGMVCNIGGDYFAFSDVAQSPSLERVLLAKLLGHTVLHREELALGRSFEESYIPRAKSLSEKEVSFFAAELLITDTTILELCSYGYTEGQLAAALGGMRELVSYKLFSMRSRGIAVGQDVWRGDFLKRCDIDILQNG